MSTTKQKLAASKILENPRKPMGKILRESGYSEAVATHPKEVTESKGWEELMGRYLQDEEALKIHAEMLDAIRISQYSFPKDMETSVIREILEFTPTNKVISVQTLKNKKKAYYIEADTNTRIRAIDMAYKLRSRYHAANREPSIDENAREQIDQLRDGLKGLIGAK